MSEKTAKAVFKDAVIGLQAFQQLKNNIHAINAKKSNSIEAFSDYSKLFEHRDIKHDNLMIACINGIYSACVIDYGISKKWETDDSITILGTKNFKAPEIEEKKYDHDHRIDYYAMGVTIYILCLGVILRVLSTHQHQTKTMQKTGYQQMPPALWRDAFKIIKR